MNTNRLATTYGRKPLGWDGKQFTNGDEGDWLADLHYRYADLDQRLFNKTLPEAVRTWMITDLARHTVMCVDDRCSKEAQEAFFAMMVEYPLALEAVEERLDNDQTSGHRILARDAAGSYMAWFGIRVGIATKRRDDQKARESAEVVEMATPLGHYPYRPSR